MPPKFVRLLSNYSNKTNRIKLNLHRRWRNREQIGWQKKHEFTWIGVSNWSTVRTSLNPCDCECKRNSGSKRAGDNVPVICEFVQAGTFGSFNAHSVYNIFKYLLSRACYYSKIEFVQANKRKWNPMKSIRKT